MTDNASFNYAQSELKYNLFVESAVKAALEKIREQCKNGKIRILDVGCGSGGHFKLFDEVFEEVEIVGVDVSMSHLKEGRRTVRSEELEDKVELVNTDIEDPLPLDDGFDLVWIADVLYPMYFDDCSNTLDHLSDYLNEDGVLGIFCGNWLRQCFLPGYSDLEHKINTAVELWCENDFHIDQKWRGPNHPENSPKWIKENSKLDMVDVETFVVSYNSVPELPERARDYVERTFRKEYDVAIEEYGDEAGITEEDREVWEQIGSPEDDSYILDKEGYYCIMHPTVAIANRSE